ncbi:IS21-like element helper ATPase IstB [Paenibacillus alginolyticus]|uniref:IS21-like element helper ATPase IstB n=2 Tax=Paenibacillus alginolyticus TaxID=59839 RepID=A0ABT4GF03_9BACL|nr:IS21-like element helper ATPase IstB [Paenibacillus alginolyticus]MCY9667948.1 IS21-like element helper ATPase IstB [Paenibacillus alginolyticus]MCY9694770.1 IS21-like element helper ATPase IstB [Paenibacillus alginolyticus]
MDRSEVRQEIALFCRQLILSQNAVRLCDLEATPKQEEFLHQVFKEELEHRERLRKVRLFQKAAFPVRKTLEGYEFQALRLPSTLQTDELTSCQFVRDKKNLVLYGPVGTGKTHLAIALGVKACELSMSTRFFTAASLVTRLSESKRAGSLERTMKELEKADLVIIDEWGYLPMDREEAQLLFQVIAASYERRSLIITTNLEFSKWGGIFTDDQMAAAMIDRLAHHGQLIVFEGESYRLKHALMRQK